MIRIFAITDVRLGTSYGIHKAESEKQAYDLMAQKAGYSSFDAMIAANPLLNELDMEEYDLKDREFAAMFLRHFIDANGLLWTNVTVEGDLMRATFPHRHDAERLAAAIRAAGIPKSRLTEATDGLVAWNVENMTGDSPASEGSDPLVADLLLILEARR